jgi:hypothetical protein
MARADAAPMSSSNPLLALLSDPPRLGKRRQSPADMALLARRGADQPVRVALGRLACHSRQNKV